MPFPTNSPVCKIASGTSLSNGVSIGHGQLVAVQMDPSGWDAASVTFAGSIDGTNYYPIFDSSGSEVVLSSPAAARIITIDDFEGAAWIKLRSGTSGSAVNQSADRVLTLLVQKLPLGSLR